jgi:hypothetical protein
MAALPATAHRQLLLAGPPLASQLPALSPSLKKLALCRSGTSGHGRQCSGACQCWSVSRSQHQLQRLRICTTYQRCSPALHACEH